MLPEFHEPPGLSELLAFNTFCLTKQAETAKYVHDPELKVLLLRDLHAGRQNITRLEQMLKQEKQSGGKSYE